MFYFFLKLVATEAKSRECKLSLFLQGKRFGNTSTQSYSNTITLC